MQPFLCYWFSSFCWHCFIGYFVSVFGFFGGAGAEVSKVLGVVEEKLLRTGGDINWTESFVGTSCIISSKGVS